ncbi:MAG: PIN domain-containing protein [Actinobacteria bacterium]|nr:PIN domain-containing protein [Actinomycetota bacterium]MBU4483456.1 PIN domain-containing protein [Actinomycetota bacterium]MCG2791684.1 PIN domain-containing protein [Actinomycetes bacterium]
MSIFIDTSAFFAILDSGDEFHKESKDTFLRLIGDKEIFHSSNYITIETIVLVQNRLGLDAVRAFQDDIVPIINIHWIDERIHNIAVSSLLIARRKNISFIDYTSFELMRLLGLKKVFTFDKHFEEQSFKLLP